MVGVRPFRTRRTDRLLAPLASDGLTGPTIVEISVTAYTL